MVDCLLPCGGRLQTDQCVSFKTSWCTRLPKNVVRCPAQDWGTPLRRTEQSSISWSTKKLGLKYRAGYYPHPVSLPPLICCAPGDFFLKGRLYLSNIRVSVRHRRALHGFLNRFPGQDEQPTFCLFFSRGPWAGHVCHLLDTDRNSTSLRLSAVQI